MKESGQIKTGWLEDAAAVTNNSDQEYMSDANELSNTVADTETDYLYPSRRIKNFLSQTKGLRGPDLGIYFPIKLLFIPVSFKEAHGQNEETAQMTVKTGAPTCRLTGWEGMEPSSPFPPSCRWSLCNEPPTFQSLGRWILLCRTSTCSGRETIFFSVCTVNVRDSLYFIF